MTKEEKLKPLLIECIDQLKKLVELGAPGVVVDQAAFNVYVTSLATYGEGKALISHLRDQNLHQRGVCNYEDCTSYVDRPGIGMCKKCEVETFGSDGPFEEVV